MSGNSVRSPRGESFVGPARRAQLVRAAAETLNEGGFGYATLTRIARRAGVSRALINYHFSDRDQLFDAVVAAAYEAGAQEVGPAVHAATTDADRLRAFIQSSIDFYGHHRVEMLALMEILAGRPRPTDQRRDHERHGGELQLLTGLLRAGQRGGGFRSDFTPAVMAGTVRRALDGVLLALAADPDLDLRRYRRELAETFDRATRPDSPARKGSRR